MKDLKENELNLSPSGKDFEEIGKQMPYAESDDYLDQLIARATDAAIDHEAAGKKHNTSGKKFAIRAALAAAAVAALFFLVWRNLPMSGSDDVATDSFASVEMAYNNLSIEDQEYLLQVYEEDLFINDNTE